MYIYEIDYEIGGSFQIPWTQGHAASIWSTGKVSIGEAQVGIIYITVENLLLPFKQVVQARWTNIPNISVQSHIEFYVLFYINYYNCTATKYNISYM